MRAGMGVMGRMGVMGLMLLVGCGQKPDPRIQKLEERVQRIADGQFELQCLVTNQADIIHGFIASNQEAVSNIISLETAQAINWKRMEDGLKELQTLQGKAESPKFAPGYAQGKLAAPLTASRGTRDGVPVEVYNRIAADAAKRWGNDYEMQVYELKNQIEAYRKLHP